MASVEVFTKERSLEIENSSVVGGTVNVDGNLILVRKDGTEINAGDVRRLLPARLATSNNIGAGVDPNTLTDTGFYSGYNWGGSLTGWGIATLEVNRYSFDWISQRLTTVEAVPRVLQRARYNGTTWGNWSQVLTDGMLESAMPERLRAGGQQVTGDWNTYRANGKYHGSGMTNAPNTSGEWFHVDVTGQAGGYITQVAHAWYGTDRMYRRRVVNNVWEAWKQIQLVEDIPDISASGQLANIAANSHTAMTGMTLVGGITQPNSYTLVVPRAGVYQINAAQLVQPPSSSYYELRINNVNIYQAFSAGGYTDMRFNVARRLNTGDTIQFFFNGALPTSWAGLHTNVSVVRL